MNKGYILKEINRRIYVKGKRKYISMFSLNPLYEYYPISYFLKGSDKE